MYVNAFAVSEFRIRVKHNILRCVCMSSIGLLICGLSLRLHSARSKVKIKQIILFKLSMRLFDYIHSVKCLANVKCYIVKCCSGM